MCNKCLEVVKMLNDLYDITKGLEVDLDLLKKKFNDVFGEGEWRYFEYVHPDYWRATCRYCGERFTFDKMFGDEEHFEDLGNEIFKQGE